MQSIATIVEYEIDNMNLWMDKTNLEDYDVPG